MATTSDRLASLGSLVASLMVVFAIIRRYLPLHLLEHSLTKHSFRLFASVYPYVRITISEFSGDRLKRSEAYTAVEAYLSDSCSQRANKLKAELGADCDSLTLSMDEHEEVTHDIEGAKLWWTSVASTPRSRTVSFFPEAEERRHYRLTFHRRHRELVIGSYLAHVLREGREIRRRSRQRKLYTNIPGSRSDEYRKTMWSHVVFDHPSTFDTLAMDPGKKQDIMDDLIAFRNGKDYYARIGKAWKRGYLLYGPPGTGNKSIIVLEDVDCSLDLTGKRNPKRKKEGESGDKAKPPLPPEKEDKEESKVTLSGLLNFIDGLWSACGGERLIIFTTNHLEKLDPALIRLGRMDKHIEMSYCGFEAFKVLAKNYLGVVDAHPLLEAIRRLMEEVKMTPADVAENLMPKSPEEDDASCLGRLVRALEMGRPGAAAKVEDGSSGDETAESELTS
ncbi:hypothetical protein OPV22_007442 [Ensete ventricosum]|uniref:AAA+ ATPase domain-containing protein n=1 Tax=Ensete ventricosum TaxID=4639 RepID=A0AAV8RMW9_ENSVE|nr:hypothetical protein OPV22_007442 [Ensete ventricosum]